MIVSVSFGVQVALERAPPGCPTSSGRVGQATAPGGAKGALWRLGPEASRGAARLPQGRSKMSSCRCKLPQKGLFTMVISQQVPPTVHPSRESLLRSYHHPLLVSNVGSILTTHSCGHLWIPGKPEVVKINSWIEFRQDWAEGVMMEVFFFRS